MMTNTYLPHTGGVARSVEWYSRAFRDRGHQVMVVAPEFADTSPPDLDVIRVPAIQHFNGSDFSVRLPVPGLLTDELDAFKPQLVHSHHPFLLGDTALRVSARRNLPIVFTHHTMYEQYTHYVPGDSPVMQRFVVRLATEYANLCDHVIAPSESIAKVLRDRQVDTQITAIPTGIQAERFARGDGRRARRRYGIPDDSYVVGHVGRLAPEKNLEFLAEAVAGLLAKHDHAHFLLVGTGPSLSTIRELLRRHNLADRLHHPGRCLDGQDLADAYHAMDVFAFSSKSETQGMVLAEAMTAGVPVVALDAPGAREVVVDHVNGRLLNEDDPEIFTQALRELSSATPSDRADLVSAARQTAQEFSMPACAEKMLKVYEDLIAIGGTKMPAENETWAGLLRVVGEQWDILSGVGRALGNALTRDELAASRELKRTPPK